MHGAGDRRGNASTYVRQPPFGVVQLARGEGSAPPVSAACTLAGRRSVSSAPPPARGATTGGISAGYY
jgi:hypothetical protein